MNWRVECQHAFKWNSKETDAKMEVTFSSHPGAQTLGIVLVLGEHHKMLHADLSLSFSPPASWHMDKKQDTRQSRILRSHLDILRSKFSVLSVLKEGKFISD